MSDDTELKEQIKQELQDSGAVPDDKIDQLSTACARVLARAGDRAGRGALLGRAGAHAGGRRGRHGAARRPRA